MPEPNPKDLSRLQTLEARLAKTAEDAKAWTGEKRELTRRLTVAEKAAARVAELETALHTQQEERVAAQSQVNEVRVQLGNLQAQLTALPVRVDDLVQQNRDLADQLQATAADVTTLRDAAEAARKAAVAAQLETRAATAARVKSETALQAVQAETERLRGQVGILTGQVKQQGKTPALPPEQAAQLVSQFVSKLDGALPDLLLQGGELHLKVAFGGTPDAPAFVLPTFDSPPETISVLHDLSLRFGHAPDLK